MDMFNRVITNAAAPAAAVAAATVVAAASSAAPRLYPVSSKIPRDLVDFSGRRLLVIGMGSIARAVLPVLLHCMKGLEVSNINVVAADRDGEELCAMLGVRFHLVRLERENLVPTLRQFLGRGDFLLNLSVDVDSVELGLYCQQTGCLYLDTCNEPWASTYDDQSLTASDRSNAMLRYRARKALLGQKQGRGNSPTLVSCCGANPGVVSWLLKQALVNLAQDILGEEFEQVPQTREGWAALAQRLRVSTIHVAEQDFQTPIVPRTRGEFVNTWSVDGFISEGIHQASELGWGTHEKTIPRVAMLHPDGTVPNAIMLSPPGAAVQVRSWSPAGPYFGFLVTHNEAISTADYYAIMETDPVTGETKRAYCPTVHYAYMPCGPAVVSLQEMLGNNSKEPERKRIPMPDMIYPGGTDELGVLVMGHEKGAYWFGSQLSIDEAIELAPFNTATSLQVVAGILAGMAYAITFPNEGLVEPEDIPFDFALKVGAPFLGPVNGVYTSWTPLQNRPVNMSQKIDPEDPWQFSNFLVHGFDMLPFDSTQVLLD